MRIRVKKCIVADWKILLQVSKTTFIASFERYVDPELFRKYINTAFTKEVLLKQFGNSRSHFYFIYANDDLAGYFKLNEAGAQNDINDPDSVELERIYVLEAFQGQNIGRQALDAIVDIAGRLDASWLWLGVWSNNNAAIRFYERHGFIKFGEHPSIISDAIAPDCLMRKDLF